MTDDSAPRPLLSKTRRQALRAIATVPASIWAGAALAQSPQAPSRGSSQPSPQPSAQPQAQTRTLVAQPANLRLRPAPAAETEIWAFDGATPGPVLRIKQGETLLLTLENRTSKPLSLHWHGLRGASEMDGVGGFSQPAVAPGERFVYRLTPPDPGTYLYRPLVVGGASEPAGRGLSGLLVVEERNPAPVDLDLPLLIGDWLLGDDHALSPFDARAPEAAAVGRLGSWLSTNSLATPLSRIVAPGARVRLRLANGCNARIMRLRFDGFKPSVVAVDSQPTETFEPVRGQLPFAPGTRYDIVFDMPATPGASAVVTAMIGTGMPLVRLVADGAPKVQAGPILALPANPTLPAGVRLQDARRSEIVIAGGAKLATETKLDLAGLDMARPWSVNGTIGKADSAPLFSVKRGTPVVIAIDNRTAFIQPLHVHGHSMRLLHPLDDGWESYFLDTVQIPEGRRLHIAFIADNPGRWLISSTVLDRFDLGLWTWFEVT